MNGKIPLLIEVVEEDALSVLVKRKRVFPSKLYIFIFFKLPQRKIAIG
jgi:hypothetical protein